VAEFLKASRRGYRVAERVQAASFRIHIPHLCSIETASIFRRWVRQSEITDQRAAAALADLAELSAVRHAHEPYLTRIWALRENVSAYDAVYVALAEALDAPLLTCDGRLAGVPLTSVTIELVKPPS
jgi:predicted nucleic acid-binding protein